MAKLTLVWKPSRGSAVPASCCSGPGQQVIPPTTPIYPKYIKASCLWFWQEEYQFPPAFCHRPTAWAQFSWMLFLTNTLSLNSASSYHTLSRKTSYSRWNSNSLTINNKIFKKQDEPRSRRLSGASPEPWRDAHPLSSAENLGSQSINYNKLFFSWCFTWCFFRPAAVLPSLNGRSLQHCFCKRGWNLKLVLKVQTRDPSHLQYFVVIVGRVTGFGI